MILYDSILMIKENYVSTSRKADRETNKNTAVESYVTEATDNVAVKAALILLHVNINSNLCDIEIYHRINERKRG